MAGRLPASHLQPTLTDLATHTTGLPRLPASIYRIAKRNDDPYSLLTENDVFAALGPKTRRPHRRRPRYSNYGIGLLGHLLARAAGRPYAELIEERILGPLNMTATRVGSCGESIDPVPGFHKGRPTPPWTFGALEAAGGLRSTINDLLVFAGVCLNPPEGSVGDALRLTREPFHRSRLPSGSVGLGWMLRSHPKRHGSALWHNGGTYGASSFLTVDPGLSHAIVACGNSGPGCFPPLDGPSWAVFDGLAR